MKWQGYDQPTWEPLKIIWEDDPKSVREYAKNRNLLDHPKWRYYSQDATRKVCQVTRCCASKRKKSAPKYKFGQKVPKSIHECYKVDKENGNHDWAQAIQKEVKLLRDDFNCFKILEKSQTPPENYQYIKLLWTFDVKFDGRKRARCVAGGHMIDPLPQEETYSSVVALDAVRLAFLAIELMDMEIVAADIGSAYIQAMTKEAV